MNKNFPITQYLARGSLPERSGVVSFFRLWNSLQSHDEVSYRSQISISKGVYRPSEKSVMNNSISGSGFNAPSREASYYRIHKMAYSDDWTYDFTAFTQAVEMPGPKPGFFSS